MRSGGLFAGYGGLDMAVAEVFGAEPAWFSEIDDAPSKVLAHHWPAVPNLGDITQIDWDTVEPVDILGGGFPCQDVSAAGKRAGIRPGNRSGLWNHMAYAVSKLRPRYVVVENVRGLLSAEAHSDVEPCPWCLGDGPGEPALRALGAVLGDLADLRYDAQWVGIPASEVGAPHGRWREFILAADAADIGHERSGPTRDRWTGSADGRHAHADADRDSVREQPVTIGRSSGETVAGLAGDVVADTESNGWNEGRAEPARLVGGPDAAERRCPTCGDPESMHDEGGFCGGLCGGTCRDPQLGRPDVASDSAFERRRTARRYDGVRAQGLVPGDIEWGSYGPAIHRWERVLGRTAPAPTELNTKGSQRLSPAFVEWMMGLPAGHVTAVPGVNRNAQLKALGNGVVPQQAIAALRHMHQLTLTHGGH